MLYAVESAPAGCSKRVCGRYCNEKHHCYESELCACTRTDAVRGLLSLRATNQFKHCGVVSSSDALLNHTFGRAIDACDAVFRVNMAPLQSFEKYVGSKTTHAVTNTPSWTGDKVKWLIRDYGDAIVYVQDPLISKDSLKCSFKHTASAYRAKRDRCMKKCKGHFKTRCRALDEHIVDTAWIATCAAASAAAKHPPKKSSHAPSSGLITVVLASTLCRSLTLFGFGLPSRQGHYYSPGKKLGHELNVGLESSIFSIWSRLYAANFTIARGNPQPHGGRVQKNKGPA